MKITDVKVIPVRDEERLKAFVTVKIDECFVVRDIKVIDGTGGLFVAMPSKKRKDGSYQDLAHPLDAPTRNMFEEEVLREYNRSVATPVPAASLVDAQLLERDLGSGRASRQRHH